MEQVTDNVYAETGYMGCNPGFVETSDGIVMIDSPHRPTDALEYRAVIEKRGKVRYLINTEPHGDHHAGNCLFDAVGVAHQGTREAMERTPLEFMKERLSSIDPDYAPNLDSFYIKLPEITFKESMKLYVGDHIFELINLPGHTASETAIFIPRERVVFTGDNLFHNFNTCLQESVPNEWLNSLEILKGLDADTYVPGHGEVCSKEYLDEQASNIKEWIASVKDGVEKGWSMEEAQERISFLERYPIDEEMKMVGQELQRMSIARLYKLAKEGQI
ncbi:MAG: MBL fold metallo-hydrolase [Deltaproteobacteria bacterium]|nr:MBL fold metallo-hydrolase [Deltaproteobacteria bacterium]